MRRVVMVEAVQSSFLLRENWQTYPSAVLRLDERGKLLGLDKLVVIHGLGIILAVGGRLVVLVLCLNVLLTHD